MDKINHINYPDKQNRIYCRKLHTVIKLDNEGKFWDTCMTCGLFNGDYQGNGVECLWQDADTSAGYCDNPIREQLRVSVMLDENNSTKGENKTE